ncbi:MAG: D-tyrosyl-tRNA(Tyr) deacylase [Methanosaeta sp. PtaB.Bin039]|nr:MAG: D-tyrosyl-tRNA(Tyr) deacylase [Methanosaeta sp. PtaB.Bin039]
MSREIAILCSRSDPASQNIASCLNRLAEWDAGNGSFLSSGPFCLVTADQELTRMVNLEDVLSDIGLHPELLVFASRHRAQKPVPWLGGHFTGILEEGGTFEFSRPAPAYLKAFLESVQGFLPAGFSFSAEATHHGPTDLSIPSLFVEIGSAEEQWQIAQAGEAVARSILALSKNPDPEPVLLGLGGGHYVPQQTDLMLNTAVSFGHMFSKYQCDQLDREALEEASSLSKATMAYLDRKSLGSAERNRLISILESLEIPTLRSREIRERYPRAP